MTSVAPPSPQVCRAKRGRLSADLDYCSPHGKRSRYVAQLDSNESGRFGAVKNRLQSLFPDMDEKIITRVLDTCQGDFDEALEKLTELSLTTNSSPTAEQADRAQTGAPQQQQSSIGQQAQRKAEDTPKQSKAASGTSHNTDEVKRWALALSDEVTAAVDTPDLNSRIFHFLTLCKQHIEHTQAEATNTQLQDLQNQNSVLKKAVAIQHARLGKHAGEKDSQIQQLQTMLSQYEARIHSLEASNYALSLHLKQATSSAEGFADRPPDIC